MSCKAAAAAGRPVNPIYGLKFLESETDFAFEGHPAVGLEPQLLFGSRRYRLAWRGLECAGCAFIRDAAGLAYIDDQGLRLPESIAQVLRVGKILYGFAPKVMR